MEKIRTFLRSVLEKNFEQTNNGQNGWRLFRRTLTSWFQKEYFSKIQFFVTERKIKT